MNKKIIFDLGGVVFKLDFENAISKLLNSDEKDFEKLFQKWLLSNSVKKLEAGKISFDEFYLEMKKEFNLVLDFTDFKNTFESLLLEPFDGIDIIFEKISKNNEIYLLSNITELHWNKIYGYDFIKKYVKYPFLSYKIGFTKPDEEIFKHVLNYLDNPYTDLIYFDDSKLNVNTAKNLGFNSFQTIGFEEVKDKLLELNII